MKRTKSLINLLLVFFLTLVLLFDSIPNINAQSDQDWSKPVNLSFSGAATNPVLVEDFRGTLHAIWVDEVDGYKYSQSQDAGVTWDTGRTVKFPFGPKDPPPFLLADKNGSIHIFWISSDESLFYGQTTPLDIADPGNWKTSSRLARNVLSYDVIVDARGSLHVAFIRNSTSEADSPAGVYYRQSIIGGGFWSETKQLYVSEYYRSTKQDDAYVRISTSNSLLAEKVFITWDNRSQKRVYMAISDDLGQTWNEVKEMKGPQDTGGIDTPFNFNVSAYGDNVLVVWQVGEPGSSKCTVYSQWSTDSGDTWGSTIAVLGGRSECPISSKFVGRDENYMTMVLIGQVSPIMVAWNGEKWSDPQSQTQLPSFSNPLTFDAILLGCRFDLINDGYLYVAGCDQGRGGDVWFLSRTLDPVDGWFSPSSSWGEPDILSLKSEKPLHISYLSSSADVNGNVNLVWAQAPAVDAAISNTTIEYVRWNDKGWANPETVLQSLGGNPIQLLVKADTKDRLLLSWVDESNGDLLYSWANLEKANLSSEWENIIGLPVPSQLVNSPDIVVGGSGRIVIAYVIPVNEERGVYIVQSSDNGSTWSLPVKVFDAIAAEWEVIADPRISIGTDGVLHMLFIRNAVRMGQSVGLYYSRSVDGGFTWEAPQILSEREIYWADITSSDDAVVHVVWQEYDGLVYANVSQVSEDGGLTWGKQNDITGVNNSFTPSGLASDGRGLLHFITLVKPDGENKTINQENLTLQDWKWNGSSWELELTKDIIIEGEKASYSLSVNITSTDFLSVFIPVERTVSSQGIKNEILALSRHLDDAKVGTLQVPIIPTTLSESNDVNIIASEIAPTPDFSILYDDNVSSSPFQRNIAGVILIGVGVIATVLLLIRRRPTKNQ